METNIKPLDVSNPTITPVVVNEQVISTSRTSQGPIKQRILN
jgi:hypothetical protein